MPLKRLFERVLLRPADLEPSRADFEVVGVFNPGAVRVNGEVLLLVRVAERPREVRPDTPPCPAGATTAILPWTGFRTRSWSPSIRGW